MAICQSLSCDSVVLSICLLLFNSIPTLPKMEIDEGERTHYQALRSTEEDLLSDSLLSEEFMELGSRRRKVQRPSSWWDALMPVSLKRHRASRTNTAFERWKANNRKAPSKAAVSLVASGIAMLSVVVHQDPQHIPNHHHFTDLHSPSS